MDVEAIEMKNAYRLLGHGPTVLVGTYDRGKVPDASAVAWAMPVSKDPARFALRIGEAHKTYENLIASGACVINVPTADRVTEVMVCGHRSGHGGDKLTPAGIATVPSEVVDAPRLTCCAAWLDCALVGTLERDGSNLVLVEARRAECRPGVLTAESTWDVVAFPTLHHLGGDRFSVPGSVLTHRT